MKIKCSIGVVVECIVYEDDSIKYLVRQPNGQPMAILSYDEEVGSYLYELCDNVIAKQTSDPQPATVE